MTAPFCLPAAPPLSGRRVLIMGMGRSGEQAARLALARGAEVTCTDLRATLPLLPGARCVYGHHEREDFTRADLIVVSPGVPARQADLAAAAEAGVPMVGELGFAAEVVAAASVPLVAITGTNGKSSTTHFCGQLLAQQGRRCFVGGNLGRPLSELALHLLHGEPCDVAVVEVSSYQMELPGAFHPSAAVVLNLTPDHLGRHGDMAGYAEAKLRIFARMGAGDAALVPPAEPLLRPSLPSGAALRWLGGEPGMAWDPQQLRFSGTADDGELSLAGFPLPGEHNRQNIAAAAFLAVHVGARREQMCLSEIRALPHRLELVAEGGGVRWINDSKATNVDAALVGVAGVPAPQLTLLGGQGKEGADYAPLRPLLAERSRAVLCFGASGAEIARALPGLEVELLPSLAQAVERARQLARPGDSVLLSPACASFDEFRNFEHRGEVFAALARGGLE